MEQPTGCAASSSAATVSRRTPRVPIARAARPTVCCGNRATERPADPLRSTRRQDRPALVDAGALNEQPTAKRMTTAAAFGQRQDTPQRHPIAVCGYFGTTIMGPWSRRSLTVRSYRLRTVHSARLPGRTVDYLATFTTNRTASWGVPLCDRTDV